MALMRSCLLSYIHYSKNRKPAQVCSIDYGLENRAAKEQPSSYLDKCSMSVAMASRSRSDNFAKRIASRF
jgi:hypothetical protein